MVASRSSIVGSVGAYAVHADYSKWLEELGIRIEVFRNKEGDLKTPGVMNTALSDDQRKSIQASVDSNFSEFRKAVTSARPQIKPDAMRGQSFPNASYAKDAGLVDAVGSKDFALSLLRQQIRSVSTL